MSENTDKPAQTIPEAANDRPELAEAQDAEAAAADSGGEEHEPLIRLERELAELKERHLRALADLQNIHRRHVRELEEVRKSALADFARDLLEVADNLRRAIESVPKGALEANELLTNLLTGVELTERQLLQVFEKYGIRRIEPEPGEAFRHDLHHAMYEVETADHRPGAIAEVMQVGYRMGERLLRPARVGIAKPPAAVEEPSQGEEEGPRGQRLDTQA